MNPNIILWVAVGAGIILLYWAYKKGKLRRVKLPRLSNPKVGTEVSQLRQKARLEKTRTEELQAILDATKELDKAKKVRERLQKRIDDVGTPVKPKPTTDPKRL